MPDYSPWGQTAMSGMGAYNPGGASGMGPGAGSAPPALSGGFGTQSLGAPMAPNQGMNQFGFPLSGASAGAGAMPQMNQGLNPGGASGMGPGVIQNPNVLQQFGGGSQFGSGGNAFGIPGVGQNSPAGGSMGGSSLANIPAMGLGNAGFGPGMSNGNGSGPFGSPMGGPPGINGQAGGPFGQRPGGQNPMMSLLLPMILQRMGMVNRPGGAPNGALPGGMNTQAGMGIQGPPRPPGSLVGGGMAPGQGGPMPPGAQGAGFNAGMNLQGNSPQRIMQGMPPQGPPMQTKSPFDMGNFGTGAAGNATGAGQFNSPPPLPTGIPMSLQTQMNTGNMMPGAGAPPPQRIMQGGNDFGNKIAPPPPMDPAAQMAQQQQQAQIANSLTNMGQMNPTQNMMAQLLMQQMPFMYR